MNLLPEQSKVSARCGAFSLTEMLVGIALVIILMGVLIPVVGTMTEKGRSGKCLGNLRQIGAAVELYISEHNQLLPPISGGSEGFFQEALASYFEMDPSSLRTILTRAQLGVFCCPSDQTTPLSAFRSYAINYYTGRSADWTSENISRRSECTSPSRILYLADGFRNSTGLSSAARLSSGSAGFSDNVTAVGLSFRHGGTANALWLDGHISALTKQEVLGNVELLYPKRVK